MGKKQSPFEPGSNQHRKTRKSSGGVPEGMKVPSSSPDGVLSEAQVAAAELWAEVSDWEDRLYLLDSDRVTPELAALGWCDEDPLIRGAAVSSAGSTEWMVGEAVADEDKYIRLNAMRSPAATAEHIALGCADPNSRVREEAVGHPAMTSELAYSALRDPMPDVRAAVLLGPSSTPELAALGLQDTVPFVQIAALRGPGATKELAVLGLRNYNPWVRDAAKLAAVRLAKATSS